MVDETVATIIAEYSFIGRRQQAMKEVSGFLREEFCKHQCPKVSCDRPCFVECGLDERARRN